MQENFKDIASEPTGSAPMTSFSDVMGYLHSIRISNSDKAGVGQRLIEETTGRYLSKAFERVDYLSLLRDDWDGNGALRFHPMYCRIYEQFCLFQQMKIGGIG